MRLRHPAPWTVARLLAAAIFVAGAAFPAAAPFRPLGQRTAASQPAAGAQPSAAPRPGLFAAAGDAHALELTLSAPLAALLAQDAEDDSRVTGRLTYQDPESRRTIDVGTVLVKTRGNTSRRPGECDFPKLTIDLPDRQGGRDPAPLFAGIDSIKLGTHCGARPDGELTPLGRWANEKAPFREALAYRLLAAAGVPAVLARPARVTYRATDDSLDVFTRSALLVETDGDAALRLTGIREPVPEKAFTSAGDFFTETDTVRLHFGQAMIGNFDWCLRLTPDDTYRCAGTHPLWNLLAAAHPDGAAARALPVVHDLDLAGTVVGRHPWFAQVFNRAAVPAASDREVEVVAQLQHARARFSRRALDAARSAFAAREGAIRTALAQAPVDDHGRALARDYVDAFFRHLEDDSFFRPVIVREGTFAFAGQTGGEPLCAGEALRRGTPVTVIANADARSRVHLLDAEWQWAPPHTCDAVTRGPVWIESAAIGRDFPR